jgi:hypothetical protein
MNKKGAELSLNVIIIAVIVIIVLVVLVIIFSGRTNIFAKITHQTGEQYSVQRCDVPGTGRFCSSVCLAGTEEVKMPEGFTCGDSQTMGIGKCCCCKFD